MHRCLLHLDNTRFGDHIDGNGLNNQRSNLRSVTNQENLKNRCSSKNSTSKYLGVSVHTQINKYFNKKNNELKTSMSIAWVSNISFNGKAIRLGRFKDEILAAKAYDEAAKIYHKEFANLNFK